jgi:hypothetical protein
LGGFHGQLVVLFGGRSELLIFGTILSLIFLSGVSLFGLSTSLALMQIQVNALLLLLERHTPGVPIKEEFQQLLSEGVQTVGLETMEGIKMRLYEGIMQQAEKENGNGHH